MEHPFFPFVWMLSHEQLNTREILGIWSSQIDLSKCATVIKHSTISINDFAGKMQSQSAACRACHIKGADIMRINLPDASGRHRVSLCCVLLRAICILCKFSTRSFKNLDLPKIDEREHFRGHIANAHFVPQALLAFFANRI
ncbi:hypothetical protein L596_003490 [Steinernema carpocapsae]|uniref:Uncharacterized protein n=1 Tax=Steinernema carpocapsae TaxID=34508 RepID=A0A4V6I816_STECR|nr:hypothetical protein L596_003490 [Steinernema carpocapsae]